jgi:hypothetical protein
MELHWHADVRRLVEPAISGTLRPLMRYEIPHIVSGEILGHSTYASDHHKRILAAYINPQACRESDLHACVVSALVRCDKRMTNLVCQAGLLVKRDDNHVPYYKP